MSALAYRALADAHARSCGHTLLVTDKGAKGEETEEPAEDNDDGGFEDAKDEPAALSSTSPS